MQRYHKTTEAQTQQLNCRTLLFSTLVQTRKLGLEELKLFVQDYIVNKEKESRFKTTHLPPSGTFRSQKWAGPRKPMSCSLCLPSHMSFSLATQYLGLLCPSLLWGAHSHLITPKFPCPQLKNLPKADQNDCVQENSNFPEVEADWNSVGYPGASGYFNKSKKKKKQVQQCCWVCPPSPGKGKVCPKYA
jgi:hypothetical protein